MQRAAGEQLNDADLPVPFDPDCTGRNRALQMQPAAGVHLSDAALPVSPDPDCTGGSERHRRDADKYGASWPLLCCALAGKSLLQHVLSFNESQPISLICNDQYPQWMKSLRFFLHRGGLHSLYLTFTKPEHLRTLGPLIARSSASLTSLGLELLFRQCRQDRKGFTQGFLKDCSQLQQLRLGRGKWKLNESCANAAWMQSLRSLTLAFVDSFAMEYKFLDAITPQLTDFTLYEVPRFQFGTIRHSFSFSNARILRFLFLETKLILTLNLPSSLTTLSVMARFVELTCQSDTPLALNHLILYARSKLRASLLCFASARVVYLNPPPRYAEYHSLEKLSTVPPSQVNPSASSELSWKSWLRKVAPTVEVLMVEHEVLSTEMDVEWHSLRNLGIVVQYTEVDDAGWEIEKDRETSVEEVYRMNTLMTPPSINAPNLQALFFPSEGSDGQTLATLKHNYPSLGLYCIVDKTFYWERKGERLRDAPLVHARGKKGGSRRDPWKPSKTTREKMHSVNQQLLEGYSVHDEEAYMLKVEKGSDM